MLKEYVRLIVEAQRGIMYPPSRINSKLQSELSSSQSNDKTHLTAEETVKDMSDKFGANYYISFVRGYKGQVPDLSVNPFSRFATPHGIYTYLLTKKNLESLFLKQRLDYVDFAMDRPYFHIIQIESPNKAVLNPDKTSNKYAKDTAGYDSQYFKDIQEMVRVSLMSLPGTASYITQKINRLPYKVKKLYQSLDKTNYISALYRSGHRSSRIATAIEAAYKKLCIDTNELTFNEFTTSIAKFLASKVNQYYSSRRSSDYNPEAVNNKMYFLKNVYKISDILSYITPNPKQGAGRKNDPVRRSLLLQSIGIDALIDAGSSTIHHEQPEQALSVEFGPHSTIKNLGTYNNIFHQLSRKELEELYIEHANYLH
tara:strand:+ start:817 stop:1926 length:1110 start_codon:yes stop_codon:yes gene_type:complete